MIREYKFPHVRKSDIRRWCSSAGRRRIERLGKERVFILTGKSMATKTDLVRKLETLLEDKWVGTYSGCQQHVPSGNIVEADLLALVRRGRICIISFGGGSPVDAAKIVALQLLGDQPQDAIPQIAITTTLSAGEFTPFGGFTDEKTQVKSVRADQRMMPKVSCLILK